MNPALLLFFAALSLQRAAAAIGGDGAALTAPDDCWVARAEAVQRIEQEQHVKAVEARSLDEWAAAATRCSGEHTPFFTPSSFGALLDRFVAVSKMQLHDTAYILRAAVRGGRATTLAGEELDAAIDTRSNTEAAFVGRVQLPAGTQVVDFGDLHGQIGTFVDALTQLRTRGLIDNNLQLAHGVALVLTGDYVDRGYKGAEVLALAMVLKIRNPLSAFLVRGNHEHQHQNLPPCDTSIKTSFMTQLFTLFRGAGAQDRGHAFAETFSSLYKRPLNWKTGDPMSIFEECAERAYEDEQLNKKRISQPEEGTKGAVARQKLTEAKQAYGRAKPALLAASKALFPYRYLPVALFVSVGGGPVAGFMHGSVEFGVSVASFLDATLPQQADAGAARIRFAYIGDRVQDAATIGPVRRKLWFDALSDAQKNAVKRAVDAGDDHLPLSFFFSDRSADYWPLDEDGGGASLPLQFWWGDVSEAAEDLWRARRERPKVGRELIERWLLANKVAVLFRGHQHNGLYLDAMISDSTKRGDGTVDSWAAGIVTTVISAGPGPFPRGMSDPPAISDGDHLPSAFVIATCANGRWSVKTVFKQPLQQMWETKDRELDGARKATAELPSWPGGPDDYKVLASAAGVSKSDQSAYFRTAWRPNVRNLELASLNPVHEETAVMGQLPLYLAWREGTALHGRRVLLRNGDAFVTSKTFTRRATLSLKSQGQLCTDFVKDNTDGNGRSSVGTIVDDRCGPGNDASCFCLALRQEGVVNTHAVDGDIQNDASGKLARIDIMRVLIDDKKEGHKAFISMVQRKAAGKPVDVRPVKTSSGKGTHSSSKKDASLLLSAYHE